MRPLAPEPDRALLGHVRRRCREDDNTGCWVWAKSLNRTGYNNTMPWPKYLGGDGRPRHGHTLAYLAIKGPVPKGMELDHLCGRRACVNPWHLEAVLPAVNDARNRITRQLPLLEWDPAEWPRLAARLAARRAA